MKPSIPKGTRDFGPIEVHKRNFIFHQIRSVFEKYGFQPIETPAMESLDTLTGKYGDEGDQLLFKILNNGDFLSSVGFTEDLSKITSKNLLPHISKRGLRYDLTVPFARFVVMHQNDLVFPFKRFQIQPVWRADRPQRGRYQEFYQCDADVVGSNSIIQEAEFISIYDEAFFNLGLKVIIKINHRAVLSGLAKRCGQQENFAKMTAIIDKLDKIGIEGIKEPLTNIGFLPDQVDLLTNLLQENSLDSIKTELKNDADAQQGITDLENILSLIQSISTHQKIEFDISLARGLSYYTGCIFEVVLDQTAYPEFKMGSLGGGGRYANLTGVFGLPGLSGAGISFGAERIYDVLEELNLFPNSIAQPVQIILLPMDDSALPHTFKILSQLRQNNISSDIYPDPAKLKKQLKYVSDKKIPLAGIIGSNEILENKITIKNMSTGHQEFIHTDDLILKLKNETAL
jgi:histidyl-tRNA synthetase